MNPDQLAKLREEAYAEIIWGADSKEVHRSLMESGVPGGVATGIVEQAVRDRAIEIRRLGRKNILMGTALLLAGVGIVIFFLQDRLSRHSRSIALGVIIAAWGIHLLIRGVIRLISGKEQGCIARME